MKVGDRLEEMTAGTDKEEAEQLALAAPKSSVLPWWITIWITDQVRGDKNILFK